MIPTISALLQGTVNSCQEKNTAAFHQRWVHLLRCAVCGLVRAHRNEDLA